MPPSHVPQSPPGGSTAEDLVTEHLPFVRHVVGRMAISANHQAMDFEDLVSYGIVGLMEAAERYEGDRGISFVSFAATRIRGAVLDAMRSVDPLSRTIRRRVRLVQAAESNLAFELGREPRPAEVQQATGLSEAQYWEAWRSARISSVSLDSMPLHHDDDEDASRDVAGEIDEDPGGIEHQELIEALVEAVSDLPERDRQLVGLRYQEQCTMREVASILGISESRVSQLEARILRRLRQVLEPFGAAA